MHVNAVGAFTPTTRELDSTAVARSRFFVDRRQSATNEAGDYLIPLQEGAIGEGHILAEIGEVLVGGHPGRRDASEITVFKSVGLAVEDVAAAHHAYRRALEAGAGTQVAFGGSGGWDEA
jgi:ornithine cyclodeaminase/alanine dehydrogenase-like protein (mu-crystallin family)